MESVERIVGTDTMGGPHRKDLGEWVAAISQPDRLSA